LQSGIRGIVLKSDPIKHLVAAVRALQDGRIFFTATVDQRVVKGYLAVRNGKARSRSALAGLTQREREVLQLVVSGNTSVSAASVLRISAKTIETHRCHIMEKLDIHSLAEMALYAVRNNLVQPALSFAVPTLTLSADIAAA